MELVLKFTTLNEQLTDKEYIQFLFNTLKAKGRKVITNALFREFKHRPDELNQFINITQNIINARKAEPKEDHKPILSKDLANLPPELLLECASYLKTNEYVNFGNCNRTLYKSLYLPSSKIQQLSRE